MYAYIKGLIQDIKDEFVIVEVSGIGYEIVCSNPYQFQKNMNDVVKIYTYYHVREDAQILFGFKELEEKELFKKLLNVSGIGPKNALKIVGDTTANEFALAIEQENDTYLTKFPGIGKKTAHQMILDLKGKVDEWLYNGTEDHANAGKLEFKSVDQVIFNEATEALKALGYSQREIGSISHKLKEHQAKSTDDLVRKGLQLLMKQK